MAQKLKVEFEVKTKDDEIVKLIAVKPTQLIKGEAEIVKSRAWGQAATKGAYIRSKVKDIVRDQGLWDETKQKKLEELDRRLLENESKLPDAAGKVKKKGLKLSEIRDAAFQMRRDRAERVLMLTEVTRLDSLTAEGIAENTQFDFLVSKCVLGQNEKPYFASLEDYLARADDPDAVAAATKFAELFYDYDKDFDKSLVENKFLIERGFVDPETLEVKAAEQAKPPEPEEFYDFEDDITQPEALDRPPAPESN